METILSTNEIPTPTIKKRVREESNQKIEKRIPERGCKEPVRINKLLEPLRQIIDHPDREKLIAEFFKDYK